MLTLKIVLTFPFSEEETDSRKQTNVAKTVVLEGSGTPPGPHTHSQGVPALGLVMGVCFQGVNKQ